MLHEGKYPQQVEINTISSGFTSLGCKAQELHRFLIDRIDFLKEIYNEKKGELIIKDSHTLTPSIFIKAHKLHKKGYFFLFIILLGKQFCL
jgi:hypothetical protein